MVGMTNIFTEYGHIMRSVWEKRETLMSLSNDLEKKDNSYGILIVKEIINLPDYDVGVYISSDSGMFYHKFNVYLPSKGIFTSIFLEKAFRISIPFVAPDIGMIKDLGDVYFYNKINRDRQLTEDRDRMFDWTDEDITMIACSL